MMCLLLEVFFFFLLKRTGLRNSSTLFLFFFLLSVFLCLKVLTGQFVAVSVYETVFKKSRSSVWAALFSTCSAIHLTTSILCLL